MQSTLDSLQLMHRLFVSVALALVVIAVTMARPGKYTSASKEYQALHTLSSKTFQDLRHKQFKDIYAHYFELSNTQDGRSTFAQIEAAIRTSDSEIVSDGDWLLTDYDCGVNEECGAENFPRYIDDVQEVSFLELTDYPTFEKAVEKAASAGHITNIHRIEVRKVDESCRATVFGKGSGVYCGDGPECSSISSIGFDCESFTGTERWASDLENETDIRGDLGDIKRYLRSNRLIGKDGTAVPNLTTALREYQTVPPHFGDVLQEKANGEYANYTFTLVGLSLNAALCVFVGAVVETGLLLFTLAVLRTLETDSKSGLEAGDFYLFAMLRNWPGRIAMLVSLVGPLIALCAVIWVSTGLHLASGSWHSRATLWIVIVSVVYLWLSYQIGREAYKVAMRAS